MTQIAGAAFLPRRGFRSTNVWHVSPATHDRLPITDYRLPILLRARRRLNRVLFRTWRGLRSRGWFGGAIRRCAWFKGTRRGWACLHRTVFFFVARQRIAQIVNWQRQQLFQYLGHVLVSSHETDETVFGPAHHKIALVIALKSSQRPPPARLNRHQLTTIV